MVRDALDETGRTSWVEGSGRGIMRIVGSSVPPLRTQSTEARFYRPSDSAGVESSLSSGSSAPGLGSRTSVASISVTTVTPDAGSSITSTVRVSTAGLLGGFIDLLFFRATFFAPTSLGLALAERFLVVDFATVRFAVFARADFEALRVRPRPVDFPFRTVDRFFRLAMIAACSSVGLLNEIPRVYRAHYWLNVEESKLGVVHQTPCRRYRSCAGESNSEQLGSYSILVPGAERLAQADQRQMQDCAQLANPLRRRSPAALRSSCPLTPCPTAPTPE
jgi:hypothetical protein